MTKALSSHEGAAGAAPVGQNGSDIWVANRTPMVMKNRAESEKVLIIFDIGRQRETALGWWGV